jgi:hypothetical protein
MGISMATRLRLRLGMGIGHGDEVAAARHWQGDEATGAWAWRDGETCLGRATRWEVR